MTQYRPIPVDPLTTGTIPAIQPAWESPLLDTAILVDPLRIRWFRETVADQMNAQSAGPTFPDLSERISDIIIQTSAQGASMLEVHLTDPTWVIPMSGMIQVDEDGFLWPPMDINFPVGTKCVWRLCQYRPTWDANVTEGNLVLTFEDRIASLLREMSPQNGGISQGQPNQTLGGFIKQLVDNANHVLKGDIQLVELISPQDPNYTPPITTAPSSSQAQAPLRTNPNKLIQGLTADQSNLIALADKAVGNLFPAASAETTLQALESDALIPGKTFIPGLFNSLGSDPLAFGAGFGPQ